MCLAASLMMGSLVSKAIEIVDFLRESVPEEHQWPKFEYQLEIQMEKKLVDQATNEEAEDANADDGSLR